jgi:uncharacterized protein YndB with AHSA1/START domain
LLPIVAEIAISAPIDHVWDVLTAEASVPLWLGCMNYRASLGSTFHMQPDGAKREAGDTSGATHCDIVLLQQPNKFNFSWYVPGTPQTLVQISLFSEGPEQSFVRLLHFGCDQFPAAAVQGFYDQLKIAWGQAVLPNLKRVAEQKP